ncbi:MAG: tetratricopeptide repeat protein [Planctomycetota bacterium]
MLRGWRVGLLGLALAACAATGSQVSPEDYRQAEVAAESGDWARAADLWNRIRLETYESSSRAHLETADAFVRLGKDDEALALLRRAGELFPNDAAVWLAQGHLLEDMGFRRAAELDLVRAAELAPDDAEALAALGRVRLALGQAQPAYASLQRAHELGWECAELERQLARCERALGKPAAAHDAYRRAIDLEAAERGAPSAELLVEAASLHTDRRGDLSACPLLGEALAWVDRAVELDPQCARASFVRAGLLERGGEHEQAIEVYRRTVEIDNLHLGALTNLALLHSNRGERENAREMVVRAVALEDDARRVRALRSLVE